MYVLPTRKISPPLRGCDIGSLARGTKNIIPRTCTPRPGGGGREAAPEREFWERRLGRGSSWGLGKENNTKPWVPPTRKISPPLRGCDIGSLARGTKNIIPRTCTPRPGRWGPRSGPRESFGRDVLVKKEISKTGVHLLVLLARYHPHYVGAASNTPARGTKNIIPRPCTPRPGRWGAAKRPCNKLFK